MPKAINPSQSYKKNKAIPSDKNKVTKAALKLRMKELDTRQSLGLISDEDYQKERIAIESSYEELRVGIPVTELLIEKIQLLRREGLNNGDIAKATNLPQYQIKELLEKYGLITRSEMVNEIVSSNNAVSDIVQNQTGFLPSELKPIAKLFSAAVCDTLEEIFTEVIVEQAKTIRDWAFAKAEECDDKEEYTRRLFHANSLRSEAMKKTKDLLPIFQPFMKMRRINKITEDLASEVLEKELENKSKGQDDQNKGGQRIYVTNINLDTQDEQSKKIIDKINAKISHGLKDNANH